MQDSERAQEAKCGLCGEPMPEGEEMFKFHGYSGGCPKPPLAEVAKYLGSMLAVDPPPSGASSQAETVAKLLLAARQVASFARAWEPLSPGDIRDLTKAIEAMDALPAPVSPVEPEPPTLEPCAHELDYHNCAECVGPKVEPEPPTTCRCLDCEPLADPGPKPSEDDINRLEKAAWDSKTDRVLVWYRDRAEMFRQRLRETERAWQLDRKKPTVEPEPCVWREKYNELLFAVERAYPGESRHETALRYIREKETVESCAPKAPLKVEREP